MPRTAFGRGAALEALEDIRETVNGGCDYVFDADIKDYFGSLSHEVLLKQVERRVSDRRVVKLLRRWLRAGVLEDGRRTELLSGTPQGGVISPLLSNVYLHILDTEWRRQHAAVGKLVRYADDFVVLCRSRGAVEEAERRVRNIFARLELSLHPEKSRQVCLTDGKEGFDFDMSSSGFETSWCAGKGDGSNRAKPVSGTGRGLRRRACTAFAGQ